MKRIFIVLMVAMSVVAAVAQGGAYNYFCGFEEARDSVGWRFKTGIGVKSNFVIGKAIHHLGSHSMYVSADKGKTAGYESTTSGFVAVAYRKFRFAKGVYDMSFDLRIAGQPPSTDVLRVAYFPTVSSTGAQQEPKGDARGIMPDVALHNPFTDESRNQTVFVNQNWSNHRGTLNITSDGEYYVAFYFKESGGTGTNHNPGACIDNIQIGSHRGRSECAAMPTGLSVERVGNQMVATWSGNADRYDLIYHNVTDAEDTTHREIRGLTNTSYVESLQRMPEGIYSFRVRAVCGSDTSIWIEKSDVLIYNPAAHCLDYLNFKAEGVTCTSGNFENPYEKINVIDYGPKSIESIHTIHYMQDEYDRLTGYELKTVPEGALASVRLSNWTEHKSPSGSIEYSYRVKPDAKVLILRYAAVLQYEKLHEPEKQTRILVEILDTNNNLLSECTRADFNAKDVDEGNTRGWKTYMPQKGDDLAEKCPIKWLDWSVLGINMEDYVGQTVKIRLTLYACESDFHFAYAYFTLECSRGDIEGMSCGVVPTHFTVSEGFDYRWYRMSDGAVVPDELLSDGGRTFTPAAGDTCSYYVDLMYPENNDCRFTLSAYTLPRVPRADFSYVCRPRGCQNVVEFTNLSAVYSYPKGKPEVVQPDTIDTYLWDCGEYGTSQERNPQVVVPLQGDTFAVILQTGFNNCYDTREVLRVEVPAIRGESHGRDTAYICDGEEVVFNGKSYDRPGDYTDTLHTVYGCDSILSLHLRVLMADSVVTDSVVCSNEVTEFFGQRCDTSGVYRHRVASSIGCDTLYYEMRLTVLDAIGAEFGEVHGDVCASDVDEVVEVPYSVSSGVISTVAVDYGAAAEAVGFVDVDSTVVPEGGVVALRVPGGVRPGRYDAVVTFHNADCGNLALPLSFDVLYPSSVITQRWNDVLAIVNEEYNGGYRFASFQWYLDGVPVVGQTGSQLYSSGNSLRFGSEYRALLTREDDGVAVMSCPYVPVMFESGEYTEVSRVVFAGQEVVVDVEGRAMVSVYTLAGVQVSRQCVDRVANGVRMPWQEGVYVMRVVHEGGGVECQRVVVRGEF